MTHRSESGQAAVEAAVTMPLALFMVLGTLQLFMMLQARTLAQYAVYKATRAGSISQGDCTAMTHAAIAVLLPAITRTDSSTSLVTAFALRQNNQYFVVNNGIPYLGQIVEIYREKPLPSDVPNPEDPDFDSPDVDQTKMRLEVRMLYWYWLKIPFANAVMSAMYRAQFGVSTFLGANPLEPVENAHWTGTSSFGSDTWPGGNIGTNMEAWAAMGMYVFPIKVNFTMRMMTPAKQKYFSKSECPLTPDS
jgi:hypothetical protein